MSEPLLDHVSDDGHTTLCGLSVDRLPLAPLCPVCVAVEERTGRDTDRVHAVGAVSRPEPTLRR